LVKNIQKVTPKTEAKTREKIHGILGANIIILGLKVRGDQEGNYILTRFLCNYSFVQLPRKMQQIKRTKKNNVGLKQLGSEETRKME